MRKNLVRFDWAIKKLLRNKANFEILEGFLSELLRRSIRIERILESEGNKEHAKDKSNRVDILAQQAGGELILIEVQADGQYGYFQRMLYGSAKLVTDYLDAGDDYERVRKVVSVNIVYFDLGQGRDYVYRGATEFRGVHHADILSLSSRQRELFAADSPAELFPEYYILKVNNFDDVARDSLDEWIYFLKNSEIKSDFTAQGLAAAAERLSIMRLSEDDRADYDEFIQNRRDREDEIKSSYIDGERQGQYKAQAAVMDRLLAKGMAHAAALEIAGLTADEWAAIAAADDRKSI